MLPDRVSPIATDMKFLRTAATGLRRRQLPSEVSQLFEQLFAACEALERDLAGAEMQVAASRTYAEQQVAEREYLFEVMPVACVEVDIGGIIVRANGAASTLLNTSAKRLAGRLLLHFAEHRDDFQLFLRRLGHPDGGGPLACAIRPREHAPVPVECHAVRGSSHFGNTVFIFLITRQPPVARRSGRHAQSAPTGTHLEVRSNGDRTGLVSPDGSV
jgi:PAS domain-containing protein